MKQECEIRTPADVARFAEVLGGKLATDGACIVTLARIRDDISRRQQKYLFGVVYPALKQGFVDKGYEIKNLDDDQFDYFMRTMYHYEIVQTSKGEQKIPKRLCFGKAKRDDVTMYISDLLTLASQLGVYIASPSDDLFNWKDE